MNPPEPTDQQKLEAQWLARARKGDPDAFGEFFSVYHARLFAVVSRVVSNPDDARDIYLSREVVEAEVLRRLARKRLAPERARKANAEIAMLIDASPGEIVEPDMRFHTALIDAIGSPRLSRTYGSLASEVVFCMSQVQGASLLPTELIAAEHERILELIEAGDEDGAAALLAIHIGRARERLAERLGGVAGPEAFVPPTV